MSVPRWVYNFDLATFINFIPNTYKHFTMASASVNQCFIYFINYEINIHI